MGLTSIEWTDRTWSPLRARVKKDAAQIARVHLPAFKEREVLLRLPSHHGTGGGRHARPLRSRPK